MKKLILLTLLFAACNSTPEGFCDCLEKGEALNTKTNEVLRGKASEEVKREMIALRKEKNEACAKFQTTSGTEMMEWKKGCAK